MSDNKKNTGKADRNKVASKQAYEVEYLHGKYPGLSHQQVYAAIKKAGPERKNIVSYLKDKGKI